MLKSRRSILKNVVGTAGMLGDGAMDVCCPASSAADAISECAD